MTENTQEREAQELFDAQVEQLLTAFGRFRQIMSADFKHAHQQGMSTTQFIVLALLEKAQADELTTIGWLANRMQIDPATVVRTVDSLEKRGMVVRQRDTRDRRQVFVEFTESGRRARQELHQRINARFAAIFRTMSDEGREALLAGLEEFIQVGQVEQQEHGTDNPFCVEK